VPQYQMMRLVLSAQSASQRLLCLAGQWAAMRTTTTGCF